MADSSITPIPSNLNVTFTTLYATVNAIINAISTFVVTANNSAAGAVTVGNGFVTGIFGATTLVTSGLRGGNSSVANTLNVTANLAINASSVLTLGNTTINATSVTTNLFFGSFASPFAVGNSDIFDVFVATAGTSPALIDSFTFITFRAAEYFIHVKDNNSNSFTLTKLHVMHDGGTAYSTEYGTLQSNLNMGTFTANANSTAVTVFFTPVSTSTNVKITRICQTV